ncbi:MAG: hypothetical protein ACE366_13835 [Bradymonadia bacterium]
MGHARTHLRFSLTLYTCLQLCLFGCDDDGSADSVDAQSGASLDGGTTDAVAMTGIEDAAIADASSQAGEDAGGPDTDMFDASASDAAPSDAELADAGLSDAEPADALLADAELDAALALPDAAPPTGVCGEVSRSQMAPRGEGTRPGAVSPYPEGVSGDVVLGALEDPSVVVPPVGQPGVVRLDEDLDTITYDVYVPPGYDGSEPYGLITFINSGNNGGGPNGGYRGLLERERLIQIAPDGAGNPVNVDIRMGRALVGTLRAMEIFNIDETRVYAMGNSGGARTANMLLYQYPQLYTGAMPRCGANYPRRVDQDYETREPDGHYEFWGEAFFRNVGGVPYIDYLRDFGHRFALMASFDDFREGDIMNVHHNGMKLDGLHSRLIQTGGGHCATNEAHFYDALGYVEHPLFSVVEDDFEDGVLWASDGPGDGVIPITEGVTESEGMLRLDGRDEAAGVLIANRVSWWDRHGLVLKATLEVSGGGTTRISLWPLDTIRHVERFRLPLFAPDDSPAVHLEVTGGGPNSTIRVLIQPEAGEALEAFTATFDDWEPDESPIALHLDAWDRELQIDTGWHLRDPVTTSGARLLDDQRTVRVRWDELPGGALWADELWVEDGAVITLGAEGGVISYDTLSVRDAAGFVCD